MFVFKPSKFYRPLYMYIRYVDYCLLNRIFNRLLYIHKVFHCVMEMLWIIPVVKARRFTTLFNPLQPRSLLSFTHYQRLVHHQRISSSINFMPIINSYSRQRLLLFTKEERIISKVGGNDMWERVSKFPLSEDGV